MMIEPPIDDMAKKMGNNKYKLTCLMTKRAKELEDECMRLYNKTVRFGIGVNVGEAVVGNIGSQKRMDFTAIGDTVNTASRLEGKALGGEIVISKALKDRLDSRVITEFKDNLQLKGKADFVEAYRVVDVLDKPRDVKEEKKETVVEEEIQTA